MDACGKCRVFACSPAPRPCLDVVLLVAVAAFRRDAGVLVGIQRATWTAPCRHCGEWLSGWGPDHKRSR